MEMENGDAKLSPGSYPMVGGDGPRSYSQNSIYQKAVVDASKQMMHEAIAYNLDFTNTCSPDTFQIADLGCSVGPNTFIAVQNIIESVDQKYQNDHQTSSTVEFQVFFNDHVDNDFNTLFKNLPLSRRYFAAGVPGTFHSRLFPKSSLHLVHTSNTIHWLSKVPKEVVDSESPAWNKDSIYCTGLSKEVLKAYSAQFKNDFECFLGARAKELVSGGLMVIIVSSLPDGVIFSQTAIGMLYDSLGSCLNDMSKLGLISEEKVESFNLPLYYPQRKELEQSIKKNGCFNIEKIEAFNHSMKHIIPSVQFLVSQFRAFTEAVVMKHFGNEVVDEIFEYFTKRLNPKSLLFSGQNGENTDLFILLKRNIY